MDPSIDEGLVTIDGRDFYVIPDAGRLPPFLTSIVSDGDRWMFVSSTGSLTAGRVDAGGALFPYETDDRLHAAAGAVGPVTRLRARSAAGADVEWHPFSTAGVSHPQRTLAKSVIGDSIVFEEHHPELGLRFGYRWNTTEADGFIRTATLINERDDSFQVDLLDGLLGVLPYGLDPSVYERLSNLSHAYKRSEVIDTGGRLAVFSLESPVSDRAEPQEVLRASVVWSVGLDGAEVTLDAAAVRAFGEAVDSPAARRLTGQPGAYLLRSALELAPGQAVTWRTVADVAQDQSDVVELRRRLSSGADQAARLDPAIQATADGLDAIMARADARQCTGDRIASAHHVANVTYNVMRGGVPLAGYRIDTADFAAFVTARNRDVATRHSSWLGALPAHVDRDDLLDLIADTDDPHLLRLGREYLPFSFSRRHGDPSRPWNRFSIRIHDDKGSPLISYEGNWRDVFQNWEALCVSFPKYLPGIVTMFVNASTPDGYNPYRVTREGIDWEVPDPEDPWGNIGYWGDHQLIYLLRLLEAADRFLPGEVANMLDERCFSYADVPYRISAYDDLVRDPKVTIEFDAAAHARSQERVAALGGDGRLLPGGGGEPVLVTLLEKLLVAALAKLANFVPGGGIWMNTQRPEWNDANNALVGYGLSMVTLHHLRQFFDHLRALADGMADTDVSAEVAAWLERVTAVLRETPIRVAESDVDHHRKEVMDHLGHAASDYRAGIYEHGFSGAASRVDRTAVLDLCGLAIEHLDATINWSRRADGLVHSYNLIVFSADMTRASLEHLPVMLEGQVAALGSGVLDPDAQADLLDALFASSLYRPDQRTFLLAPVHEPPGFVDKNVIPADEIEANALLASMAAAGESKVIQRDVEGHYRFHPDLVDESALRAVLDGLAETDRWGELARRQRQSTLDVYELVFRHHSFLGRSAAMYAYEGIGSVYWHMVAKLLVVTQEAAWAASDQGARPDAIARLVDAYDRVRAGLGFNKRAAEFGAIPIEPYSHTPAHAGAQQPGMTGAVKEEILVRPGELGVRFEEGEVVFDPVLLRRTELLEAPEQWTVSTVREEEIAVELGARTLGLTVCQVPFVVGLTTGEAAIEIDFTDGRATRRSGVRLGREVSAMLFGRTGEVQMIRASLPDESGSDS